MTGPLAGVCVLDLTQVVLGPYATQGLAEMGADVIKVEPLQGDSTRRQVPGRHPGMSAMYLNLNRNKRSIAIDLKAEGGRKAFFRLVQKADVLVHNMRADAARRLGVDAAVVCAAAPRLIYCSAYGFSERGRYAGLPAYDDIIQAACGLADCQGAGGAPRYVNTTIADKVTGLTLLSAITMALFERERSGQGQSIVVPMFESMVSFLLAEHMGAAVFDPGLGSIGYSRVLDPHRRPYRTGDGFISVMPKSERQWLDLFRMAGCPELTTDPRFNSLEAMARHSGQLQDILDEALGRQSTGQWLKLLAGLDVPAMAVRRLEDLHLDPHLQDIGFFSRMDHPSEGTLRCPGIAAEFSRTPVGTPAPAPKLGEHGRAILAEAGFSEEDIALLIAERSVALPPA